MAVCFYFTDGLFGDNVSVWNISEYCRCKKGAYMTVMSYGVERCVYDKICLMVYYRIKRLVTFATTKP